VTVVTEQSEHTNRAHGQGTQSRDTDKGKGAQSVMIKTEQVDRAHCITLCHIARTDIQAVQHTAVQHSLYGLLSSSIALTQFCSVAAMYMYAYPVYFTVMRPTLHSTQLILYLRCMYVPIHAHMFVIPSSSSSSYVCMCLPAQHCSPFICPSAYSAVQYGTLQHCN
jgi:EamA domain-containing membrane protein RarD